MRPALRLALLVVAVLGAGGVLAALAARNGGDAAPPPSGHATVTVETGRTGAVVPRSFLGLSIEWDSVVPYAGTPVRRRAVLSLLAPIARAANSPVALRVGGDTSDQAWWNPAGRRPRPRTVLQDIGPATLDTVAALAHGLGGPVTLGLNLALRDPRNALALARAARRRLGPGGPAALELGNEPDLYTKARTFRRGGHLHRRVRKYASYGPADYRRDVDRYLKVLRAGLRPVPRLVVGGFAGNAWWPAFGPMLDAWRGRVGRVAAHLYADPQCDAAPPTAAWLAGPFASRGRAHYLAPLIALARRHRLPVTVAELNSVACGGRPRLSDTPAAALWLCDTLFALLAEGATGADLHTWDGAIYAPFAVTRHGARPRPPLAGLLAFARAAPSGSRLATVRVTGGGRLRAWATVAGDGAIRVALLAPAAVRARIAVGDGRRCATLWRPGLEAARPLCPHHGRYAVALPARTLGVVTVVPSR